jgi:23S rRNA maturation-related 3'-5' exoribonuclease YhaM
MTYMEKIDSLLEENLTEISFQLWKVLKEKIPYIWDRLSSSTGKYHRRKDGRVPSVGEHTWEMLIACIKLLSVFNVTSKTLDSDVLLFSVVLHDSWKYGIDNPLDRQYTDSTHDRLAANMIEKNKSVFLRVFSEDQFYLLEKCIRHHSGRWSSDSTNIEDLQPEVFFVHILDMMSTNNLLLIGEEN